MFPACWWALFVKKYKEPGERVSSANYLLGAVIKGLEDEENANNGKKEVEMELEEMAGLTLCTTQQTTHHYIQAAHLKKHQHHDPPRPPASSDFKLIGECNLSTSCSGARSLLHGDALLKGKLTCSFFNIQLF